MSIYTLQNELNVIRSDDLLIRLYNSNAPAEIVADRMDEVGATEWAADTRKYGRRPILDANSCYSYHVCMLPGAEIERRYKQEKYFTKLYPFMSYIGGAKKAFENALAVGVNSMTGESLSRDEIITCRDRLSEIDGYLVELKRRRAS